MQKSVSHMFSFVKSNESEELLFIKIWGTKGSWNSAVMGN